VKQAVLGTECKLMKADITLLVLHRVLSSIRLVFFSNTSLLLSNVRGLIPEAGAISVNQWFELESCFLLITQTLKYLVLPMWIRVVVFKSTTRKAYLMLIVSDVKIASNFYKSKSTSFIFTTNFQLY
jgi:hypothetical protein